MRSAAGAPRVGRVGGLHLLEAVPDAVEKGFAQLRDQRGLVAHRRRQSRIDCTRIISHRRTLAQRRLTFRFLTELVRARNVINGGHERENEQGIQGRRSGGCRRRTRADRGGCARSRAHQDRRGAPATGARAIRGRNRGRACAGTLRRGGAADRRPARGGLGRCGWLAVARRAAGGDGRGRSDRAGGRGERALRADRHPLSADAAHQRGRGAAFRRDGAGDACRGREPGGDHRGAGREHRGEPPPARRAGGARSGRWARMPASAWPRSRRRWRCRRARSTRAPRRSRKPWPRPRSASRSCSPRCPRRTKNCATWRAAPTRPGSPRASAQHRSTCSSRRSANAGAKPMRSRAAPPRSSPRTSRGWKRPARPRARGWRRSRARCPSRWTRCSTAPAMPSTRRARALPRR